MSNFRVKDAKNHELNNWRELILTLEESQEGYLDRYFLLDILEQLVNCQTNLHLFKKQLLKNRDHWINRRKLEQAANIDQFLMDQDLDMLSDLLNIVVNFTIKLDNVIEEKLDDPEQYRNDHKEHRLFVGGGTSPTEDYTMPTKEDRFAKAEALVVEAIDNLEDAVDILDQYDKNGTCGMLNLLLHSLKGGII